MADRSHIELFTDGACSGNPGPGGWAYVVRDRDSSAAVEASGGEPQTTNNRMELLAVINGLRRIESDHGPSQVDLYSDSEYVVKGLASWMDGWKANRWRRGRNMPVKNLGLWQTLDELRDVHEINAEWVRGHADHPENERCDRLAVAAAERYKEAHAADGDTLLGEG